MVIVCFKGEYECTQLQSWRLGRGQVDVVTDWRSGGHCTIDHIKWQ